MQKIKRVLNGEEVEIDVAHVFDTPEDFKNAVKSEVSKGKGEILQALGVSSVDEAKNRMGDQTEVKALSIKMEALQKENRTIKSRQIAIEAGVKPELVDKVLILAEAAGYDDTTLADVIKTEATAIGAIKGTTSVESTKKIGTPKTKEEIDLAKAENEEMEKFRNLDPLDRG